MLAKKPLTLRSSGTTQHHRGFFSLTVSLSASATQVQALVEAKNTNGIVSLIHPSADPTSVERLKATLALYFGANKLKVYPVPKDDNEAVRQFLAQSSVPGALKPLEERIKKYSDNGAFFEIAPLGDLVISGT